MGMTLAEKILAAHAGVEKVHPGQFIEAAVDVVLANDITAPIAIREFEKLGVARVFDPERVVMVADHFVPNKDIRSAEQCAQMRRFARQQGLPHHFDVGRMGIEHVLLPEQGLVLPGDVVVGADSHTCTYGALGAFATGMGSTDIAVAMATGRIWMRVPETMRIVYRGELQPWVGGKDLILYTIGQIGVSGARYKAIEFAGPAVDALSMAGRFTMANMAIEAGGKAGLFAVDEATRAYVDSRASRPYRVYQADDDAAYAQVIEIDASQIEPQVAFPHLPENARPVSQAGDVPIDQVVIGSCTNGRLEDLRVAA
ncbi:MAG: 3-isopropylmalate dehydratase large subunit, partial [Chloroflexi bacterium]|nr:3-isopropylmalate dehydratase large subunit [Chloroflexota bacterium]